MSNKTIAVVGAGPGLGLSIARRFGREGYRAALIARKRASLDQMIATLRQEGVEAEGFVGDIADEASLSGALAAARDRFGPIDVLEFSPTAAPEGDAHKYAPIELDRATADRIHRLQVLGAVTSVQAVLPDMLARGDGGVLITTSGSAFHVMPVYTPVGMAMASSRNYALCLNAVLKEKGIYAGTVCIGVLIRKDDPLGDPDRLADTYFDMYSKRDRAEIFIEAGGDLNQLHDRDMQERGVEWRRP